MRHEGVVAFDGSVRFARTARQAGLRLAVVSSSANCADVLAAAGIADLFELRIDGTYARENGLRGKPEPDTFLAAAAALGVAAEEAAVFEDALAGVAAGRAGRLRCRGRRRPRGRARGAARRRRRRRGRGHRRAAGGGAGMNERSQFAVEPWCVRETRLDLDALARTESMFALANGHIGLRANLDEGEPFGLPGTYLNSFFELRPLPYAEAGYGYPESGQTLVNVTNGKIIRLLVDDEPFDIRYGELRSHERVLDLRAGVLRRSVEWISPAGAGVRVQTTRLVSFVQRAAAAILFEVEPLDGPLRVVVQSELVTNEAAPPASPDPRVAAVLDSPLSSEEFFHLTPASCSSTPRAGASCALPRRWITSLRGRRVPRSRPRARPTSAA